MDDINGATGPMQVGSFSLSLFGASTASLFEDDLTLVIYKNRAAGRRAGFE
jgi:hypothetical protein